MRTRPEGFEDADLVNALTEGWALEVVSAEYAPLGFGSYHWFVADAAGDRHFVTVDDLDHALWLGRDREEAFANLRRAFASATALAERGLAFVLAPVRTRRGETVVRVSARHTVALFPFVEAEVRDFGRYDSDEEAVAVAGLVAELHAATPVVRGIARVDTLALDAREHLEAALRENHVPWAGGPFSERAREVVTRHEKDLRAALRAFDRLSAAVARDASDRVITHGEPHAANVLHVEGALLLIDWDTAALAPPERDLWMVTDSGDAAAAAYAEATGHAPDRTAIDFFRLRWDLTDTGLWIRLFRAPHADDAYTREAFDNLTNDANVRARWSSLL